MGTLNYVPSKFIMEDSNKNALQLPEIKMALYKMLDPLILNFRIFVDQDQNAGLLGGMHIINETAKNGLLYDANGAIAWNIIQKGIPYNSALNFLDMIGEYERRDMLVTFIASFIKLIRDYDFLLLDIDGLDQYFDTKIGTLRWDDTKIRLQFNETVTSMVQGIIQLIRNIVYDFNRECYVLPGNLQSFTFSIMIYNTGYFNTEIYDADSTSLTNDISRLLFPTINKLNTIDPLTKIHSNTNGTDSIPFNYSLIEYEGNIDIIDSGRKYYDNITNNGSGVAAITNLTLDVFQWQFSSSFKQYGSVNIAHLMALSSELSKYENMANTTNLLAQSYKLSNNKSWMGEFGDSWGNMLKTVIPDVNSYVQNLTHLLKLKVGKYMDPSFLANYTGGKISPFVTNIMQSFNSKISDLLDNITHTEKEITVKYEKNIDKYSNENKSLRGNNSNTTELNNNMNANTNTNIQARSNSRNMNKYSETKSTYYTVNKSTSTVNENLKEPIKNMNNNETFDQKVFAEQKTNEETLTLNKNMTAELHSSNNMEFNENLQSSKHYDILPNPELFASDETIPESSNKNVDVSDESVQTEEKKKPNLRLNQSLNIKNK